MKTEPDPTSGRGVRLRVDGLRRGLCGAGAVPRVFALMLWVALLALAAHLVFLPDARDELRRADRLFATGRYHDALVDYARLSMQDQTGEAALRLGMVRTLRGEYGPAERALRRALAANLASAPRELALLYLGQAQAGRDQRLEALRTWEQLRACGAPACPYDGPRRVLRAELNLRRGDYAAAESDYRAALAADLAADWRAATVYRLALLRAARDPDAALAELRAGAEAAVAVRDPFLTPLRPAVEQGPAQLEAVLGADPASRPQLLGQLYLDLKLYPLAEAQFNAIAPDGPDALAAAAYAAYTRWRAGEQRGGLERLEALVAGHPQERRARTLLALAYLSAEDTAAARTQLEAIAALAPGDAETHLAWANWYVVQRDYPGAGDAYQRALERASPAQRGRYALLVARFHLATTFELCDRGLPAAERAARELSDDGAALTTLAAARYHCQDFAGAAEAARAALARAGDAADATFYLGSALKALGERAAARSALVRAADLAPASDWRARAEAALVSMP